ncbi:MAG: hypothetical protein Kow0065_16340 [Methylomicrobium sp.]
MNNTLRHCKIIVPVDFSDFCRRAFPVAQEFARFFEGMITPFHAYDLYSDLDGYHYLHEQLSLDGDPLTIHQQLEQALEKFTENAIDRSYLAGCIANNDNDPVDAIIEASRAFDLVVMSSHGRKGFSRILLGAVAEKVLRLTDKPIVIVEDDSHLRPIEKILVTTDFSENSYAALPYARDIARAANAEIHLFHAVAGEHLTPQQFEKIQHDCLEKMRGLAAQHLSDLEDNMHFFVVLSDDSIHNAIRQHIGQQHYNLLIMSTLGRAGNDHPLGLGSTIATLVRAVNTTIMAVKPAA